MTYLFLNGFEIMNNKNIQLQTYKNQSFNTKFQDHDYWNNDFQDDDFRMMISGCMYGHVATCPREIQI
jgi:hypothetical protein